MDQTLSDIVHDGPRQEAVIQEACTALLFQDARAELSHISTEELKQSAAGIRVSALQEAGFTDLSKIDRAQNHELLVIQGIGDKQLQTIRQILAVFTQEIANRKTIRLDAEANTAEERALLAACARFMRAKDVRAEAEEVSKQVHDTVERLSAIPVIKNRLRWIFSTAGRKEQTIRFVSDAEAFLNSPLFGRADRIMTMYEAATHTTEEEALSLFRSNTAPFYALIESVSGAVKEQRFLYDSIPEQLAASVQAFLPDLRLFHGSLRAYQEFGVKYILHQKRVLLGDEMGLGKTVEAIAAIAHLAAEESDAHYLVICPASVLINWCREIETFCGLRPYLIHGKETENNFRSWADNGGIGVTNYESMGKIAGRIDNVMRLEMLVIDEAHYIKNPDAKRTKYIRMLDNESERILLMTGTPLENRADEMCELIDFVRPDLSGEIRQLAHLRKADVFRELIAPVYLRRLRRQVLTELPELEEITQWCAMTDEDARCYAEAVSSQGFQRMRRISFLQDDMRTSAKAVRLKEICEEAGAENRKTVVYSFFLETIEKVSACLGSSCIGTVTGATDVTARQGLIDRFAKADPGSVLVCQVLSGGIGLNIQAASVVIFCEPQIKPSLTKQALSRVYRMGQARDVMVHHLICPDTVDEAVMNITSGKQAEFDLYAEDSTMHEAAGRLIDKDWINRFMEEEKKKYLPMVIG